MRLGFRRPAPGNSDDLTPDLLALERLLEALSNATTASQGTLGASTAIASAFGFDYGAVWQLEESGEFLRCVYQTGDLGPEFAQVTMQSSMRIGTGMPGRAWQSKSLILVPDWATEMRGYPRGEAGVRAGVSVALAFPLFEHGQVIGTMDFFSIRPIDFTPQRTALFRSVARVCSQAVELMRAGETANRASALQAAITAVLTRVGNCVDESSAQRSAVSGIAEHFGWTLSGLWQPTESALPLRLVYGSEQGADHLAVQDTDPLVRAWHAGAAEYFDLTSPTTSTARCDAARAAGMLAGCTLPIRAGDQVIAVADLYRATTDTEPSVRAAQEHALLSVAQRLAVIRIVDADASKAAALMASVNNLSESATEALQVAEQAFTRTEAMSADVDRLRERSAAVDDVVRVISGIAKQTNLLALNAAIEASRAGEAGLGFGVVAGEVKVLAQQTSGATHDVTTQIREIQDITATVADGIGAISDTIRQMNDVPARMSSILREQTALAAQPPHS